MHIFEIVVPGDSLEYQCQFPRQLWDMEAMLHLLQSNFFEANLALNLFEQSRSLADPGPYCEIWQREWDRKNEIEEIIEQEHADGIFEGDREDIRFEVTVRFKREQWASGSLPGNFQAMMSRMHAKTFISALDIFDKCLWRISLTEGAPPRVAELHKKFATTFPQMRGVRNTTQHLEDRVRGLDRDKKPIKLKPITNGMVPPELPVLALNILEGSKFRTTMENGGYGEVDISSESMRALQEILQEVLRAFSWKGQKQHLPSAADQ